MAETTLGQRVQRLEDLEAIRALTMELAGHFDNDYDADAIVELFSEDALLDGGAFGQHHAATRSTPFSRASPSRSRSPSTTSRPTRSTSTPRAAKLRRSGTCGARTPSVARRCSWG